MPIVEAARRLNQYSNDKFVDPALLDSYSVDDFVTVKTPLFTPLTGIPC